MQPNNLGIIIQARLGSTRYAKKMIIPFYAQKGLLEVLLNRLVSADLGVPLVLAIPDTNENEVLAALASKYDIDVYRGDEENVLSRFIGAAEKNRIDKIIRVCADNPLLDLEDLRSMIRAFSNSNADYLCYSKKDGTPTIKTHYGFWAEGVTTNTLRKVSASARFREYIEHVTNYIYNHPDSFKIDRIYIDEDLDDAQWLRCTVDTEVDFENASMIYGQLGEDNISGLEVLEFSKERPDLISDMKSQISGNTK
jgi:spore coat polysaccharide biosynthesis protein SpsF